MEKRESKVKKIDPKKKINPKKKSNVNKFIKTNMISNKPILSLLIGLGFLSVILVVTMMTAAGDKKQSNNKAATSVQKEDADAETALIGVKGDAEMIAVVKEIDIEENLITLFDIDKKEVTNLAFSGGTNITDKYGQPMASSQIMLGVMVDVSYLRDEAKIVSLQISKKAWEYVNVMNLSIDRSSWVMQIVDQKYKFTDDVLVLDGEEFIPVDNLAEQDELTIRGYEETIWSITVDRGHGTVKLEDYARFLGAYIEIGYESLQQIADNMTITVREGNFNLTVDTGSYTATKNITVKRNQETLVTLGDMGPEAAKFCKATFQITPFGAALYVDGEMVSFSEPLELEYGLHSIEVTMPGYTAYEGSLNADVAGKTIKIDLPESTSEEEATVTETDTDTSTTDTDTSTADTDNTDADTTDTTTEDTDTSGDTTDGDSTAVTGDATEVEGEVDKEHFVYVQNPTGASVYLDGDYMCASPGFFQKVIGTHVITFIKAGYDTMSYTIEINDDNQDMYINMPDLVEILQ
ncbi:MAG: PEGA domain-containing protein [Mobilitalea sp.]